MALDGRPVHELLSSTPVVLPPPPDPSTGPVLPLPAGPVDLTARVLVAGVVPSPRFGREGEVTATAAAVAAQGADLVDVSLEPRLIGPAVGAVDVPVVTRAATVEVAVAAGTAGAAVVLLPPAVVAGAPPGALGSTGASVVVLVDGLGHLAEGIAVAARAGIPVGIDSWGLGRDDAIAAESLAVSAGCRLIRTGDVRRSRRVAEVLGAVLAARAGLDADESTSSARSSHG